MGGGATAQKLNSLHVSYSGIMHSHHNRISDSEVHKGQHQSKWQQVEVISSRTPNTYVCTHVLVMEGWLVKCQTHHYVHRKSRLAGLLFGANEKLLTQHISGPVTKYKLL